jgi:hypothetical protein
MEVTIDSPDIQGCYIITQSDDKRWYVTRISNAWKNGGQNAIEWEHPKGFTTSNSARRWVARDMDKILNSMWEEDDQ